jgi:nucleoside-diphosphate-sugar epimerase
MPPSPPVALITGGSGFVGSHLAGLLARMGYAVRALVRRQGEHPGLGHPRITQLEGDFVDPETARRACDGAEVVVHSAATLGTDLDDARRVNVGGTAGLAAARAAGCARFVHISTISVYDWACGKSVFDETAPLKIEVKPYPHSPAASPYYGLSKAEGERALREEMERGLPATIFRLGAVLGLHPTSSWSVLVPAKVRAGEIAASEQEDGVLPWTHAANVSHAVGLAIMAPEASGQAYNVVDGHATLRRYFGEIRCWFPEADRTPAAEGAKAANAFAAHCPGDKLRYQLGYEPLVTFGEGMEEAARYWRRCGRG